MIEPVDTKHSDALAVRSIISKLNELIEAFNNHVHYVRELQFPTSTPDNTKVH